MATLVLGAVGSAIGGSIGGAIFGVSAATIGGFVGSTLGSAVDSWIVSSLTPAQRIEGARLDTLRITSSTEGAVIPRLYGRMRIGGNIIWATDFRERKKTSTQGGGKGGGGPKVKTTEYLYYASFAVALCEGPITGIGRIWADGKLLDTSGLTWRWYPGDEIQTADPFIAATMGMGNTPAYRGTAYVLFEDLPLANFGNRLPQLSFEVFRPLGGEDGAENLIRAVTLIPSAGEFVYATTPIRKGALGTTRSENVHARADAPDLNVALDQLQAALPNLESVSLVVSWFGDDLRAGHCTIRPCIETGEKTTTPQAWRVNGLDRVNAPLVSRDAQDRPVFGGTPADFSVVEAIREIKARGWRVTFYPFLLMDVPSGNTLPTPYSDDASAIGQPALPWRGRITCAPAAGFSGTVDQTAAAAAQVAALFGAAMPSDFTVTGENVAWTGGVDWGLRRMILHYAHLCTVAGGVDAFLIGSEMRGLTTIRAENDTFPAVQAFRDLAADVRGVLGSTTRISYAADWSEYFGHHVTEAGDTAPTDFSGITLSTPILAGDYKVYVPQLVPDFTSGWRLHVYSGGPTIDLADLSLGSSLSQTGPDSQATYYAIHDLWIGDVPLGTELTYTDIMTIQQGSSIGPCNDVLTLYGLTQTKIDSVLPDGLRMASFASVIASRNLIESDPGDHPRSLSYTRDNADIVALRIVLQLEEPYYSGNFDKLVSYSAPVLPLASSEPVTSVFFHLDPLWADPEIGFIGIDNYMPLSDWRDGSAHLDAEAGWPTVYDRAYLQANIEGGEGFDWFYASDADRTAQIRTPVEDGSEGKPWVFRYKDLNAWWSNLHFDRPGGVESGSPTAWIPQSKPIVFTECGCPAIDRGTNQPNVFFDPKSSESAVPYFSRGWRDDAIQRAYYEALLTYWGEAANNPVSTIYSAPMIDLPDCAAWTWDARPYPHFPALTEIWTDGPNWQRGHWLTGRMGGGSLAALVRDLCLRAGLPAAFVDTTGLTGSVEGYILTALESPRASISTLARHFGFDAVESEGQIRFLMRGRGAVVSLTHDDLVAPREGDILELVRAQETELPQALKWQVTRADGDYDTAQVEARRITVDSTRVTSEAFPIAVPPEEAERRCQRALMEAWTARESATFRLPPSRLALDPADVVTLAHDGRQMPLRLVSIADSDARGIEALRQDLESLEVPPGEARPTSPSPVAVFGAPEVTLLDLPQLSEDQAAHQPFVAAFADPWPGDMAVFRSPSTDSFEVLTTFGSSARIGALVSDFHSGPTSRFDLGNALVVDLFSGTLEGVSDLTLFGGANALAVETAPGVWEILQAGITELIAPGRYRLTRLLRGQRGTEGAMGTPAPAGARVVVLDETLAALPIAEGDLGLPWNWRIGPATRPVSDDSYLGTPFTPAGVGFRPFSVAHVEQPWRKPRSPGDLTIRWTRRSRALSADSWGAVEVPLVEEVEAYEVEILDGGTVKRSLTTSTTSAVYAAAEQITDWGVLLGPGDTLDIRIFQLSASVGRGTVKTATLIF
ncbi:hypothetical protein ROE7235_02706 [Roseibaca ekhonensis]|uniref:Tip attachment protein J domain-containing protein n=1 Tax=Roseinatronobacter ekhonensis TaxID=254356 RepID=A0A3B0MC22_9RHOB|nr:glycoside hydrolase TIM-barrel-like domain-containing protein [Roseibaca ekhonensis]SUZ32940.1 hypothetical protein ROE7235_02706 [Roseibaca ekhonensis]